MDVWRSATGQTFELVLPPMVNNFDQLQLFEERRFRSSIGLALRTSLEVIADGTFGDAESLGDGRVGLALDSENFHGHDFILG